MTFWNQGRWKEAEELFGQVEETFQRVVSQTHPDTLAIMACLATTYLSQERRTKSKELQIEAFNQLRTTVSEDHPSMVAAIVNLAAFHEERAMPAPFCGANELMERLRDTILQSATPRPSDQGKDGQETLESPSKTPHKQATEHGDEITEEEKPQIAVAMSLDVNDNKDTSEEGPRRSLDPSVEADADSQTNPERFQHALSMLTIDENDSDGFGSFKATPIGQDEGNETHEERLQLVLAMSMMDENDC